MKLLQYAVFATAVIVGLSAEANAHEGHNHVGHDHGSESQNPAASGSNTPPAPPSDSFVPESRPLESGPASRERVPNFTPNPNRQPSRDFRSFEPKPLNFGPESRPSRSVPQLNDRSPYARPNYDQRPNRLTPEFDARPRDFAPDTLCPLGRSIDECCPSARNGSTCPNQQGYAQPRPCPYGRDAAYECAWEATSMDTRMMNMSPNHRGPLGERKFGRMSHGRLRT